METKLLKGSWSANLCEKGTDIIKIYINNIGQNPFFKGNKRNILCNKHVYILWILQQQQNQNKNKTWGEKKKKCKELSFEEKKGENSKQNKEVSFWRRGKKYLSLLEEVWRCYNCVYNYHIMSIVFEYLWQQFCLNWVEPPIIPTYKKYFSSDFRRNLEAKSNTVSTFWKHFKGTRLKWRRWWWTTPACAKNIETFFSNLFERII